MYIVILYYQYKQSVFSNSENIRNENTSFIYFFFNKADVRGIFFGVFSFSLKCFIYSSKHFEDVV